MASEIAGAIERDPVAASQVQEHIKPERLRELLGLTYTNEELLEELERRMERTNPADHARLVDRIARSMNIDE